MPRAALVRAGLALWLVSFVTPDSRAHSLGGAWLLRAPLRGTQLLAHALATSGSNRWQAAGLGMALLLGFAANFTLLLRPGNRALLLAATLPWIPWLTYLQLWQRGTLAAASPPWTLLYFYPWVLGLLLV